MRYQKTTAGAVIAIAAFALSGCGGHDSADPAPSTTAAIAGDNSADHAATGNTSGGVSGAWYSKDEDSGNVYTLTFTAGSLSMKGTGLTCTGSVNGLKVSMTCAGQTMAGNAVVSDGGQKLVINWADNSQDDFTRQRP